MRGSESPFRTRRSSASEDGRVLVGSRPTRVYIVRTAAISAGGRARTAASAAASGASRRVSRSTTVAPSSQRTPGRTIEASLWSVEPGEDGGIAVEDTSLEPGRTGARLAGGRIGHSYSVSNRVTLSDGTIEVRSISLRAEPR